MFAHSSVADKQGRMLEKEVKLLEGSEIAGFIKQRHFQMLSSAVIAPKLAIVQESQDRVVSVYSQLKQRYGEDIGVDVEIVRTTPKDTLKTVKNLSADVKTDAIIVQLPLQEGQQTDAVLNAVDPAKDVDGLGERAEFDPATPTAILWLLSAYNIELKNKRIAVVGQGRLVGSPLVKMLRGSRYDVRAYDEHTTDLGGELKHADIIISATGQPGLITSEMLREGAVVIDAGTADDGGTIKGDVDPALYTEERDDITITPPTGGVGPLTVAVLFDNVIRAARGKVRLP